MKHRLRAVALALLLLSTAGCGDSFATLLHETLATYNEMADNMLFVCDEDTAEVFVKMRMEKITKRYQGIAKRAQDFLKRIDFDDSPKIRYEITNLFIDYSDEYVAVIDRIKEQVERLNQIRIKIYIGRYGKFTKAADLDIECPNLTKVMNAPEQLTLRSVLPNNSFDPGALNQAQPQMPGMQGGEAAPAPNFPKPPPLNPR